MPRHQPTDIHAASVTPPAERGGRIFFSNTERSLMEEDVIDLTSVGVDIGSSTSHLVISELTLERLDSRYVVTDRRMKHQSEIILTPYSDPTTLDVRALGAFIEDEFAAAGISRDDVDTGALILTGVAVRRKNARAVGELFADQAGKFVAVSAGDRLETVMSAYGSGAAARSSGGLTTVMNIDIGGGTSKISVCRAGDVVAAAALDVGARLFVFDDKDVLTRIEEAGHFFADKCGLFLTIGERLDPAAKQALAGCLADHLTDAIRSPHVSDKTATLLRTDPLGDVGKPDLVTFSGGVSEYIYDKTKASFGDLGPELADAITRRLDAWGIEIAPGLQTIRATVIGASQYTVQVSGSTIFLSSADVVPLRNAAVITPRYDIHAVELDPGEIAAAVGESLRKMDLQAGHQAVAVCLKWAGSATFHRIDALSRGLVKGLKALLNRSQPLILVTNCDIGGLIGIHCREELALNNAIISIDGIELKEFDYIDIGGLLQQTGAVPVVIKSLIFPGEGVGRPVQSGSAAGWQ